MSHSQPFSFIFGLSEQQYTFLQQFYVKKGPSSIRQWDSNSPPSDIESPHLTNKPGLLAFILST